jgi:hypothetical protein
MKQGKFTAALAATATMVVLETGAGATQTCISENYVFLA